MYSHTSSHDSALQPDVSFLYSLSHVQCVSTIVLVNLIITQNSRMNKVALVNLSLGVWKKQCKQKALLFKHGLYSSRKKQTYWKSSSLSEVIMYILMAIFITFTNFLTLPYTLMWLCFFCVFVFPWFCVCLFCFVL